MRPKDTAVSLICLALGQVLGRGKPRVPVAEASRILVLKPCCLGDVLMATPLLATLRTNLPEAHISFAVSPWARPVIHNNPHVDEIVDCGRVGSGRSYGWAEYWDLVRTIRAGGYDYCFVLERSPVLSALPFLARISGRIGLDSFGRGFSLTTPVPARERKHEAELYLDTARAVGFRPVNPALEFYPSAEAREQVAARLTALSLPEPLVIMHPGGGANPGMTLLAKRWPASRFANLADRLIESYSASIIVVGGDTDGDLAQTVVGEMKHCCTNLTGQLSLDELGALCQRAGLYVGNDTGATHLAAAAGAKVVAIFGPSSPAMYGAYGPRAENVWKDVGCNPCFVLGRVDETCAHPCCIEAVEVDDVWPAVQRQMGGQQ